MKLGNQRMAHWHGVYAGLLSDGFDCFYGNRSDTTVVTAWLDRCK